MWNDFLSLRSRLEHVSNVFVIWNHFSVVVSTSASVITQYSTKCHLISKPGATKDVISMVDIWPDILCRFSSQCVTSDCGQLRDRLMLNFNIPVNIIWYFYWNHSTDWHYTSHDFILDLRPESSCCIDQTTFSLDACHYLTPAVLTLFREDTEFSINSSTVDLQSKSNETLQTWDSISGDSPPRSWRTYYVMPWVVV